MKLVIINHPFTPYILAPPVFRVSHQTRVATIGSRVQLTCIVDGTPIPVITWSKQDGQLPVYDYSLYVTEYIHLYRAFVLMSPCLLQIAY